MNRRRLERVVAVLVLLAVGLSVRAVVSDGTTYTGTAYFDSAIGIYVGDDVTILGVDVGKVTAIVPEADQVRMEFTYDRPLPADVHAVIATPSLVPVRNLALTPAYESGPKLADGGTIPVSRTAVPVEWDDVKTQLTELATALGPKGANKDGSLSRVLDTTARNIGGRGQDIRVTVSALSEAMGTLADNQGSLFATVRNLDVFVRALKGADAQIAQFNGQLADVSTFLGQDSEQLARALVNARAAMADLRKFFRSNGDSISETVKSVRPLMDMLAQRRTELGEVLHVGPTAISNLYGLYDPLNNSLAASLALDNVSNPATLLCSMMQGLGGASTACHDVLAPLAGLASLPGVGVSPVQRNSRTGLADPRTGEPITPSTDGDLAGLLIPGGAS